MNIFCYSSGIAGRDPLSADGPMHLINQSPMLNSDACINLVLQASGDHQGPNALAETARLCELLAQHTKRSVENQEYFMTLSGDHSSAIGTWSGAFSVCQQQNKIPGLIWIDAHIDSHTPQSSPSQNIHGMPLAALLGYGYPELKSMISDNPKLCPEHVVLIGIRSYEPPEQQLLEALNVKIYYIEEVQQRGYEIVLREAIDNLNQKVDALGVTIDIDAIDPVQAPGVSTPAANGINATDVIATLPLLQQHPKLIGCEITEFLPSKDIHNKTESIALQLIEGLTLNRNNTHLV